MIAIIQCAGSKRENAGSLRTQDGRKAMFVADPALAPRSDELVYAHPDGDSGSGASWRDVLRGYNENYKESPSNNPLGILPAWQLYCPPTYELLANHFGLERLYILSAGWGLLRAGFLTPDYDITFSSVSRDEKFKRRSHRATFHDFCLSPSANAEEIVFFGGKSYVPLFCKLTAAATGRRTVFFAGTAPAAPGCILKSFGRPYTNWQYKCAGDFVRGASD